VKKVLLLIVLVGLIVGAAVLGRAFPAANASPIDLDLLWLRIPNLQVWSLVLVSIGFGGFLASLILSFFILRGWVVGRRYRKIIKRLESEVHQLRSLPLATDGNTAFADPTKLTSEGHG
jgi:uncharacterized membrane protein YciS (DUF1049 family)